jgi:CDGSH-type Zn-finger protein
MNLEGRLETVVFYWRKGATIGRRNQRARRVTMAEQTKITALDNGPYLVKGPILILDPKGNEFRAERAIVALCRCGGQPRSPSATAHTRRSASGWRRGRFGKRKRKDEAEIVSA